ncbi:hypothetical protein MCOR25_002782 [Pyricularia grisea]|uniref:RRM domain-containing protein n=1 Tax=Pyricularia grisea TaxID=148305 RepID=A0A6P8ARC2_PYRGI|nr:uncharacterized protein PgNI_09961 [Pyricularia grisea]KAI6376572.1 hypothetical protein MCOR25_002782 [Pyricularia grisea]TLD04668.1 hypothetical protein PgNI_09961 [Pyricularia grisea]
MGSEQPAALLEGRRIYLGNLLYVVQPVEVEDALVKNGFGTYQDIHISVDPVTARNPGYCFVDFPDRATAERALTSLHASIRGRPLKVGPCEPKQNARGGNNRWKNSNESSRAEPAFKRWGNWSGQRTSSSRDADEEGNGVTIGMMEQRGIEQGPYGAIKHFNQFLTTGGRRLYVGGLGKMIDQQHNQDEVREILAGLNPIAISKRITPHPSTESMPGKHHYCFVDFATAQEAYAAAEATNGRFWAGGRLRVSIAKDVPDRLRKRGAPAEDNAVWRKKVAQDDPLPAGQQSSWRRRSTNDHNGGGTSQRIGSLESASWR